MKTDIDININYSNPLLFEKQEILSENVSKIESGLLLGKHLQVINHQLRGFLSAS